MDPPETSGGDQGSNVGESSVKTSESKAEMMTTKELLVETLDQLSPGNFSYFKSFIPAEPSFLPISRRELEAANTEDVKEVMMKMYRGAYVEETKKILRRMGRLDLVERLAGVTENPSLEQKVGEMESVLELLLETLSALSEDSLSQFWKQYLDRERSLSPADITDVKGEPFPLSAVKTELEILAVSLLQREGKLAVDVTKMILTDINETHLVQRLWDHRSRNKKNPDDHLPALLHKAATMAAVKELLLETLINLNPVDFEKFKIFLKFTSFQKKLPEIPWSNLQRADCRSTMNLMLATYGQRCLEVTSQVLTDMNQTDLLAYLPEKSDGAEVWTTQYQLPTPGNEKMVLRKCPCGWENVTTFRGVRIHQGKAKCGQNSRQQSCTAIAEKLSVEELRPGLIDKVEAMESVLELLLETLGALNEEEQQLFIDWVFTNTLSFEELFQYQLRIGERFLDLQVAVFEMVQQTGLKSVETTKKFLMEIKRPDLLQRIKTCSKRQEKKLSVDERRSAVVHKVALMAAFKQLLTDVLRDLKQREIKDYNMYLDSILSPSDYNPYHSLSSEPVPDTVNRMMEMFGLRSLDVSMEILRDINRSDLVQKLLENSSGLKGKVSVDEYLRADVLNRVPAKVSLKRTLRKMMNYLDRWNVRKFKWLLQFTCFQKGLPDIRLGSRSWPSRSLVDLEEGGLDPLDLVDQMVQRLGQESVDVAREVLTDMKRTDVVQKLTGSSLGSKEELQSLLLQKKASLTAVMKKLLETFEDLDEAEFERFWETLQKTAMKHRRRTPTYFNETKWKVAELMLEQFDEQSLDVAMQILKQINRSDLVQKISVKISTKELSPSLDPVDCKSAEQDSWSWTKVDPEEDWTSPDEAPTYRLRSEAGHFECRVSGLRWVCEEKVSFRYRFCSWNGHMLRMEGRGYRPAGPLMDITVFSGKMMEVQLPHWVCIDDVPQLLENFAVLHVNDCGDVLEKVTGVTATHVRIRDPFFCCLAPLINYFFPPKITCNTLIYYQPKTPFLKLRIYLIPLDPALKLSIHREETSLGYEVIKKPRPDTPLKMDHVFALKATIETAKIQPSEITLGKDSPNFYEVFIQYPDRNFNLELLQTCSEKVWHCEIRKDDHPKSGSFEGGAPTEAAAVKTEGMK